MFLTGSIKASAGVFFYCRFYRAIACLVITRTQCVFQSPYQLKIIDCEIPFDASVYASLDVYPRI